MDSQRVQQLPVKLHQQSSNGGIEKSKWKSLTPLTLTTDPLRTGIFAFNGM